MALVEPQVGRLRQAVQVRRRAAVDDGYGNREGEWLVFIARRAALLTPTRGGEQVIAERLQGQSSWDLWLRFDSQTSQIQASDQVVDLRQPGRVFAVRFVQDMTGKRHWLLAQLTLGDAT